MPNYPNNVVRFLAHLSKASEAERAYWDVRFRQMDEELTMTLAAAPRFDACPEMPDDAVQEGAGRE